RYLEKDYQGTIDALSPIVESIETPVGKAEAYYLIGSSNFELHNFEEAKEALRNSWQADQQWRNADQ
ncbi:MAG: hypothetical protein GTO41_22690, partial [Burkholderiales bacterium]|nr:hypothetical protein [Burkholderiales bacterium]